MLISSPLSQDLHSTVHLFLILPLWPLPLDWLLISMLLCSSIAYLSFPSIAQLSLAVVFSTQLASCLLHRLSLFPYLTFCLFFCLTSYCTSPTSTALAEDICDLWLPYCQNPRLISVFIWDWYLSRGWSSSPLKFVGITRLLIFYLIKFSVSFIVLFPFIWPPNCLFFLGYFLLITLISFQVFKYHHVSNR